VSSHVVADPGRPSPGVVCCAGEAAAGQEAEDDLFEQLEARPEGADCVQGAAGGMQAGSLRRHSSWWRANARSSVVRGWVESGFPLLWKGVPAPPCDLRNSRLCSAEVSHTAFVTDSVQALVRAGAVKHVLEKPRCVSPLAVVPKKGGKLRLILNLQHVNKYLSVPKFR
jgi:hypothetical protein